MEAYRCPRSLLDAVRPKWALVKMREKLSSGPRLVGGQAQGQLALCKGCVCGGVLLQSHPPVAILPFPEEEHEVIYQSLATELVGGVG